MRIAFTADLHLTTSDEHPERFNALRNILEQCAPLNVDHLIIAGDLFDQSQQDFADFEALVKDHSPEGLRLLVLPGNHDPDLRGYAFALGNLEVCEHSELRGFGHDDAAFLLLPYQVDRTMGEEIAPFQEQLVPGAWVLVGHGDWAGGLRSPDPYEKGVYMPLTRSDLNDYQPAEVFLGHIHLPYDEGRVHFPGSPCPMNITETGLRRFLVYDTQKRHTEAHIVESDVIYFDERFVLVPVEDEEAYLREQIAERIAEWGLPEGMADRARVRLTVSGYVIDRSRIEEIIQDAVKDVAFYKDQGPDLSALSLARDSDRIFITRQVQAWLEELEWPAGPPEPTRDDLLIEALRLVYGA